MRAALVSKPSFVSSSASGFITAVAVYVAVAHCFCYAGRGHGHYDNHVAVSLRAV